jgi:hypothetical protein
METGPDKGIAEAPEDRQSPTDKLVEGIREFVREQMQRPGEKPAPQQPLPNWKDAFWLAVFIADLTLLFSWFPEEAKGPLEFLGKFLPWLLGSLFVVANDWFRNRLLEISRVRWLRSAQLTFLIFGLTFGRIQLIPITAAVNPTGTRLIIDGEERASDKTIWLTVGNHKVLISEGQEPNDKVAKDREFKLQWWQLLGAAFFKRYKPDWRLVYQLDVMTPKICTVTVTKQDGRFDGDFLEHVHVNKFSPEEKSDTTLQFQSFGPKKDNSIELPSGQYVVERSDCNKPSKPFPVDREHRSAWDLSECPQ